VIKGLPTYNFFVREEKYLTEFDLVVHCDCGCEYHTAFVIVDGTWSVEAVVKAHTDANDIMIHWLKNDRHGDQRCLRVRG